MTDYVLRVPAGILLPHFSSSSSPPSPVWNAPDHLCVHIVDWGSKTGRYCEILAKGFLDLRQFLLLRYGCCACVCWRLVSRHDFFFHVDQFLVQLIFYFIQRLQSYNPTSSKLNNLETVRIFKKKWPLPFSMWFDPLSEGGCNYKLNTSLKNIRLYDWPIAQIS